MDNLTPYLELLLDFDFVEHVHRTLAIVSLTALLRVVDYSVIATF
jgi:hypothetical protein